MASFTLPCLLALLTAQLASPHFATRERASQALAKLVPASLPYLQHAAKGRDLEAAVRATAILQRWRAAHAQQLAEALCRKYGSPLWVDCLPNIDGRSYIVGHYRLMAEQAGSKREGPVWEN